MAWIYAVAGNKGGPGKTSEVVGLAYALASRGYRVAVADMDAQGNATRRLGVDKAALIRAGRPGIAEMLDPRRPADVADVVTPCGWPEEAAGSIAVLPSLDRESLNERAEEGAKPGAAGRLRRALDHGGWADDFHVVLIDTGPDVNHLLHNALVAADRVVLVTGARHDDIEGAVYIAAFVDRERANFGRPDLAVCGVVVNAYDRESSKQREHVRNLPATFEPWGGEQLIWQPYVPHRFSLANSHDDAVPITAVRHAAAHDLAITYERHADLLLAVQKESVS